MRCFSYERSAWLRGLARNFSALIIQSHSSLPVVTGQQQPNSGDIAAWTLGKSESSVTYVRISFTCSKVGSTSREDSDSACIYIYTYIHIYIYNHTYLVHTCAGDSVKPAEPAGDSVKPARGIALTCTIQRS